MTREWKPGDVAALSIGDQEVRGIVNHDDTWRIFGHSFYKGIAVDNDILIQAARPLVVIDPENGHQVGALLDVMRECGWTGLDPDALDDMQRVLREFADPPKPEEPKGLGAVIEDENGVLWTRAMKDDLPWIEAEGEWSNYTGINVVRVLSEGVTNCARSHEKEANRG